MSRQADQPGWNESDDSFIVPFRIVQLTPRLFRAAAPIAFTGSAGRVTGIGRAVGMGLEPPLVDRMAALALGEAAFEPVSRSDPAGVVEPTELGKPTESTEPAESAELVASVDPVD